MNAPVLETLHRNQNLATSQVIPLMLFIAKQTRNQMRSVRASSKLDGRQEYPIEACKP